MKIGALSIKSHGALIPSFMDTRWSRGRNTQKMQASCSGPAETGQILPFFEQTTRYQREIRRKLHENWSTQYRITWDLNRIHRRHQMEQRQKQVGKCKPHVQIRQKPARYCYFLSKPQGSRGKYDKNYKKIGAPDIGSHGAFLQSSLALSRPNRGKRAFFRDLVLDIFARDVLGTPPGLVRKTDSLNLADYN